MKRNQTSGHATGASIRPTFLEILNGCRKTFKGRGFSLLGQFARLDADLPNWPLSGNMFQRCMFMAIDDTSLASRCFRGMKEDDVKKIVINAVFLDQFTLRCLELLVLATGDTIVNLWDKEEVLRKMLVGLLVVPRNPLYGGLSLMRKLALRHDAKDVLASILALKKGCADIFQAAKIEAAVVNGNSGVLKRLLKTTAIRNNRRLLFLAACDRDRGLEVAKLLIINGARVNAKNSTGATPLHQAVTEGGAGLVQLLINAGAEVNTADKGGCTPLHAVAALNHTRTQSAMLAQGVDCYDSQEIMKLLIASGAPVDAKTRYGFTPLHLAAARGASHRVQLLIDAGADVNAVNELDFTPLHYVANVKHEKENIDVRDLQQIAKVLIGQGAGVNAVGRSGVTPLHIAAFNGCTEIFRILLDAGADVNLTDEKGEDAFATAAERKKSAIIRIFQELQKERNLVDPGRIAEYAFASDW